MERKQAIIEFLKENGPSHPIQVNKVLGLDSFTASAILKEMLEEGLIKRSVKRVGGSPLYYLEGQEERMREMVLKSLNPVERKVVEEVRDKGFLFQEELPPQARYVINELRDVLIPLRARLGGEEKVLWKFYKVSNEEVERRLKRREAKEKEEVKKVEKEVDVEERLSELGEIVGKEMVKRGEVRYLLVTRGPLRQRYIVIHKKKSKISDVDLNNAYAESVRLKTPVILVSKGKLTKKARALLKEVKNLVHFLEL